MIETATDVQTQVDAMLAEWRANSAGIPRLEESIKLLDAKVDGISKKAELIPSTTPVDTVKLEEAGILGNLAKTEFMGVEVGKIAIGTFGGVFVSELVDGFLPSQSTMIRGGVKLVMAGIVGTWGKRWVGRDASMAIALILGVFGLSQVLPVDKWAANLAAQVKGILPGTIKVVDSTRRGGNVLDQASQVALNYYPGIAGRVG